MAELLCCDCERVLCNSLYFLFLYFILYCGAVVSAGYPALLSSSYFERINDDDDDDENLLLSALVKTTNSDRDLELQVKLLLAFWLKNFFLFFFIVAFQLTNFMMATPLGKSRSFLADSTSSERI